MLRKNIWSFELKKDLFYFFSRTKPTENMGIMENKRILSLENTLKLQGFPQEIN